LRADGVRLRCHKYLSGSNYGLGRNNNLPSLPRCAQTDHCNYQSHGGGIVTCSGLRRHNHNDIKAVYECTHRTEAISLSRPKKREEGLWIAEDWSEKAIPAGQCWENARVECLMCARFLCARKLPEKRDWKGFIPAYAQGRAASRC